MDNHTFLLAFLIFLAHFGAPTYATNPSLCTQTPYPELCNSLVNTTPQTTSLVEINLSDLRDTSLRATLAQAQNTLNLIENMNLSSFNDLAKSAWTDCLELYQDTVYQLNRSVGSKSNNEQTWLSAAIANEQTCRNGFLDFNLSSQLQSLPFMSSDFTKFLSNSLAINKANIMASSSMSLAKQNKNRRLLSLGHDDEFPEWVSFGDRKLLQSSTKLADIVVAQDGSGNYKTISEGLAAAAKQRTSSGTNKRFVIYVKKGIYKENVEIMRSMKNLMLIGDGIDAAVVTGNRNVQDGSTTFRSATFAVALRSSSDLSIFYQCSFKGYQDTLYVYSQRQFYRDCDIYGTTDFIFGDSATVIQNSNIYIRKLMSDQKITVVTAQGRNNPNENTGIVIHNSRVTLAGSGYRGYLGRPWREYSRTVYMKCRIDGGIDPEGWMPWNGNFGLSTLYYGEYMNTGGGASTSGRVKWPGYHVITSAAEAGKFSVGKFLAGDSWIPATGVPCTSGL
ncbi:hypothetical protein DH2020_032080 [Rehmannia glutinosa]|uniref:Pectinesterase n=1 Tax=Rehmannia glutinosa TaxID=99300 RepID=A0ABR0VIJ8_REHGL